MATRNLHRLIMPALLTATAAEAQDANRFQYYRLPDAGWEPHGLPAINNRRDTAFLLFDGTASQLYYSGGDTPYYNYVADTYGPFADFQTWTINDLGSVAYVVEQDDGQVGIYVLYSNETNRRTVLVASGAQDGTQPLYVSMDEANRIAFATSFYSGVNGTGWNYAYFWAGGSAIPLASHQYSMGFRNATIANDASYVVSGPQQEMFGTPGSGLVPIGPPRWTTSELNDAGQAAAQNSSSIVVYRPANGDQVVYTNTTGGFQTFLDPVAINNRGQVAFEARRDDGVSGVFSGPDPQADLVLRNGQTIFGRTVSLATIGRNAINDRGQVAMHVWFTDQTTAIVIADPLAGDIDMDCRVDLADLSELLANFGGENANYFDGDVVQNNRVDLADLAGLLSQFGLACPE